jgi:hypothetical protein
VSTLRNAYRIDDDHVTILAIDHRADINRPDEPRGTWQSRMFVKAIGLNLNRSSGVGRYRS